MEVDITEFRVYYDYCFEYVKMVFFLWKEIVVTPLEGTFLPKRASGP